MVTEQFYENRVKIAIWGHTVYFLNQFQSDQSFDKKNCAKIFVFVVLCLNQLCSTQTTCSQESYIQNQAIFLDLTLRHTNGYIQIKYQSKISTRGFHRVF